MDSCDVEPMLHIRDVYLFEGLEYGIYFSLAIWLTDVKHIFLLRIRNKGILLTKNRSYVK